MLSRTARGSALAGLCATAVIMVATAPPVTAEAAPAPSGDSSTGATPSPEPTPTDPAPSEPGPSGPDPSEPTPTEPPPPEPTPNEPTPNEPAPNEPSPNEPTPNEPGTSPSPGPDPGGRPTPGSPSPPWASALSIEVSVSSQTVRPGGSITAHVRVSSAGRPAHGAVLRLSATKASVSPSARGMGSVGTEGVSATAAVGVPPNAGPGTFTLQASVSAAGTATVSRSYTLIVTSASGAIPAGVTPSSLWPGLPPVGSSPITPLSGPSPQVVLPPAVAPQVIPRPWPLVRLTALRSHADGDFEGGSLATLQAGWLAALSISLGFLLARLRMNGLTPAASRRLLRAHPELAGKRLTAARLRTLPPRPAPVPKGRTARSRRAGHLPTPS